MIVLINGATATFRRYQGNPCFGLLATPRSGNLAWIPNAGHRWACDNDCGPRGAKPSAFDPARFRAMLDRVESTLWDLDPTGGEAPSWVACPDVVGDADATQARFDQWSSEIASRGIPVAYVAQDGAESRELPWDQFACLFIGGSTGWKLGQSAEDLADEARRRGKWLHMGRVNSGRRFRHAFDLGCDSVDGTSNSRWANKYFPLVIQWSRQCRENPSLLSLLRDQS